MMAFGFLANERLKREKHGNLSLALLAQNGDEAALKKQFDEWERDF